MRSGSVEDENVCDGEIEGADRTMGVDDGLIDMS